MIPVDMAEPHALLQAQWQRPWLVGVDGEQFWRRWQQRCRTVEQILINRSRPTLVLAIADPVEALAGFLAACSYPVDLWLGNPTWGQREWQQVGAIVAPDILWTDQVLSPWPLAGHPPGLGAGAGAGESTGARIWIPTGGSSGQIRFAGHTWATLRAAVVGFCQHFAPLGQGAGVRAYCVLPLYHVSGLMQALRCVLTEGTLWVQPFQALQTQGPLPGQGDFVSLVPTQLQRLLANPARRDWLGGHRCILVGGGPPWTELLTRSRQAHLPLAPTYGMTETAAQVATLLPQEFLAGHSSSGRSLPHCTLTICTASGEPLPPGQPGLITIDTPALALGYHQGPLPRPFQPGDRGYLTPAGYLQVLGRADNMIISGGEKIQPEEVESALLGTGLIRDGIVVGCPDEDWGEVVVAIAVPLEPHPDPQHLIPALKAALRPHLSPYKLPKRWYFIPALPRTPQGKIDRSALRSQVL